MEILFIVLLIAAVLLLWHRVSTLGRKLDELEVVLRILRRNPKGTSEPAPQSPVQRASAAPAPTMQEAHGETPAVTPALLVALAPLSGSYARTSQPDPVPDPAVAPWIVRVVRDYLTGGNLVVRVGIIVLFFGVAFLLTYVAEHTQLSIQMRLAGVAAGAVVLFALGWRLRHRRRGFSLALQGGSIGVMYLTLFASLRLYALIPAELAFALMAALGVVSCLLAVRQDALALSMLGATGGFLAPVLASTGQGSHVVLFSYYALLDVFIVAQAWFKAWRPLNLLAFVFTFGVGAAWGVMRYEPAHFATTEPFLLFFFLAFITIAVLFALRSAPRLAHYVDGTLVFGTPVAAMALQMELVRDFHHGRAWSALGAGLVYLLLAAGLNRLQRDNLRLLKESFIALGIAFLTLAVPLWFDDTWTSSTWALEGAALVWMGLKQGRRLPTTAGLLLQIAAAITYLLRNDAPMDVYPLVNAGFTGAVMISIAGLLSARMAVRPDSILKPLGVVPSHLALGWGLGWWLYAAASEVRDFVPASWQDGAYLGVAVVTGLASAALVSPLKWPALRVPALLLLPVMVVAACLWTLLHLHPFNAGGWLAWPASFAALWLCLHWHGNSLPPKLAALMHGLALWLLALLAGWELSWQVAQFTAAGTVWADVTWALMPTLMLAALASRFVCNCWPVRVHPEAFRGWVACGLATFLLLWSLLLNWDSNGAAAPLPYLPLVNPLDIAVGFALLVVARWLRVMWHADPALFNHEQQKGMIWVLAGTIFVWLNAVLLRSMHHWLGVPYQLEALAADTTVQASLSIFWTLLALGTMLWANRSGQRATWFGGAGLMAVVVAKLFLVDLVHVGTLPRIVSFLVVGGLMLVIGYFSPLPPVKTAAAA
ncbi:MAG: DUF2339 domain-containing protein [Pseudomonadota bacterium]